MSNYKNLNHPQCKESQVKIYAAAVSKHRCSTCHRHGFRFIAVGTRNKNIFVPIQRAAGAMRSRAIRTSNRRRATRFAAIPGAECNFAPQIEAISRPTEKEREKKSIIHTSAWPLLTTRPDASAARARVRVCLIFE